MFEKSLGFWTTNQVLVLTAAITLSPFSTCSAGWAAIQISKIRKEPTLFGKSIRAFIGRVDGGAEGGVAILKWLTQSNCC